MDFIDGMSSSIMENIKKAGQLKHTLYIRYNKKGAISERETEPYEIKEGAYWGYDVEAGSIKRFALNNILDARVTENAYSPRWAVKL